MQDRSLYIKILHFVQHLAHEPGFLEKLQDETGWSNRRCQEGLKEYARFIYLATINTSPVTPSDVIDGIWHLHLTFTRSYWDGLCGEILLKPLHHEPGSRSDALHFQGQYRATLERYAAEFASQPPQAYWFVTREPVVNPKTAPSSKPRRSLVPRLVMASAAFGTMSAYATNQIEGDNAAWIFLAVVIGVVALLMWWVHGQRSADPDYLAKKKRRKSSKKSSWGSGGGSDCGSSCGSSCNSSSCGSSCGGGGD